MIHHLVLTILSIFFLFEQTEANQLKVTTDKGIVQGTQLSIGNGNKVLAWLGIPYAQAKRFEVPVPANKWSQPLSATSYGPSCWQSAKEGFYGSVYWNTLSKFDENCLSLNIFKPANAGKNLPVVVWIHSGAFTYGSSAVNVFDLREFASGTNTIAISLNYRLGVFGFLKTDKTVKGNMGLLDQQQALIWIKKNIKRFGGDAGKVTLAGEGAGASSVSYHLLAGNAKKLFQQAIILNGDPISNWYFDLKRNMQKKVGLLSDAAKCPKDEAGLVNCLKKKSAQDLVDILEDSMTENFGEVPFAPTIDKLLLSDDPIHMMTNANFNGIKIIVGTNHDAGSLGAREILPFEDDNQMDVETFKISAKMVLSQFPDALQTRAIQYYLKNDRKGSDLATTFSNLIGDLKHACSTQQFADMLIQRGAQVHKAIFSHRPKNSKWPKWAGVAQGDELMLILGEPLRQSPVIQFTEKEKNLSKLLMTMFGNFIKQTPLKRWPKYDSATKNTLQVEKGEAKTVKNHYHREKFCEFWRQNNIMV